jgi:hypothetical protein
MLNKLKLIELWTANEQWLGMNWVTFYRWYKQEILKGKPDWPHIGNPIHSQSVELDCCNQATIQKKDANPMHVDNNVRVDMLPPPSEEVRQRDYLLSRLRDAKSKRDLALQEQFGMRDEAAPETFEEMIERIKKGKFRMSSKIKADQKLDLWHDPLSFIRWRSKDKDEAGYDAASEKMRTEYTKAKDQIMIQTLDKGLKALEAFEA